MSAQLDLFGSAPKPEPSVDPVPGLAWQANLITPDEEAALIARIDAEALAPFRFQGWTGKRLTYSFGWSYDFEDGGLGPAEPIPDWLLPFRGRAAEFAGLEADRLVQALLIRYDPGAGIGWHRDRPVFGPVIGLSLGTAAMLRLRRREETGFRRQALPLPPRSAYLLSGEARRDWEHSILPLDAPRWSVTFRTLAG